MQNLGVVQQDSTIRFGFQTAAADGGEENFSATLEEADFIVRAGGSTLTLTASTITVTNVSTGIYEVAIDLSNDADFTAGLEVLVFLAPNDETIDTQSVSAALARFVIETDAQMGVRRLQEMFSSHTVGATGNTTSAMHASFLPASLGDDEVNGEVWAWYDASEADWLLIRVTDYVATGQVATVELLNKAVLPAAPASGDYCFRVSHNAVDIQRVTGTSVTWSATRGLAGTALPAAAADAAGGLPVSDLGGLDLDTLLGRLDAAVSTLATASALSTVDTNVDTLLTRIVGTLAAGTHNPQSGDAFSRIGAAGAGLTAVQLGTDAVDADALATAGIAEIVAAIFARAFDATDMSGLTFEELVALMACVLLGKASGLGTATATFRNIADGADAVVSSVDADGNRSSVTRNLTAVR